MKQLTLLVFVAGCGAHAATSQVAFQSSTHLWEDETEIVGTMCFERTHWNVERKSDGIMLSRPGARLFVASEGPSAVRILGGARTESTDIRMASNHLIGHIGSDRYELARRGDHLAGTYRRQGNDPIAIELYGMERMTALPPAEQGALLESLLTCSGARFNHPPRIDWRDLKILD